LTDEVEVFNASEPQVRCVTFSPRWKDRLACVGSDECLHFWDIRTGETFQRSPADTSPSPLPPCEDAGESKKPVEVEAISKENLPEESTDDAFQRSPADTSPPPLPLCEDTGEAKKPVEVEATSEENLPEERLPEPNLNIEAVPKVDENMEVSPLDAESFTKILTDFLNHPNFHRDDKKAAATRPQQVEHPMDMPKAVTAIAKGKAPAGPKGKAAVTPLQASPPKPPGKAGKPPQGPVTRKSGSFHPQKAVSTPRKRMVGDDLPGAKTVKASPHSSVKSSPYSSPKAGNRMPKMESKCEQENDASQLQKISVERDGLVIANQRLASELAALKDRFTLGESTRDATAMVFRSENKNLMNEVDRLKKQIAVAENKEKELQMAQRRVVDLEEQLASAQESMATLESSMATLESMATLNGGGAFVETLVAKDLLLEQSREILANEEAEIDADQQLRDDATVLQSLIAANQTIQKKNSALEALRGIIGQKATA